MKKYLYFAYGSNLNLLQMKGRCPEAQPIGRAVLPGHKLTFRGVADVIPAGQGHSVPGAAWAITSKCLKALDLYEGYPNFYDRKKEKITMEDGQVYDAIVYYMKGGKEHPPSPGYYHTIADGYGDFGIDREPLAVAAAEAAGGKYRQKALF